MKSPWEEEGVKQAVLVWDVLLGNHIWNGADLELHIERPCSSCQCQWGGVSLPWSPLALCFFGGGSQPRGTGRGGKWWHESVAKCHVCRSALICVSLMQAACPLPSPIGSKRSTGQCVLWVRWSRAVGTCRRLCLPHQVASFPHDPSPPHLLTCISKLSQTVYALERD